MLQACLQRKVYINCVASRIIPAVNQNIYLTMSENHQFCSRPIKGEIDLDDRSNSLSLKRRKKIASSKDEHVYSPNSLVRWLSKGVNYSEWIVFPSWVVRIWPRILFVFLFGEKVGRIPHTTYTFFFLDKRSNTYLTSTELTLFINKCMHMNI